MEKIFVSILLLVIVFISNSLNKLNLLLNYALNIGIIELILLNFNYSKNNIFIKSNKNIKKNYSFLSIVFIILFYTKHIVKNTNNKSLIKNILLIVSTSDFFQELSGKLFGKNKLKFISFNKTYEGYFGGYLLLLLTNFFILKKKTNLINLIYSLGVSGDLLFSYVKRIYKIKNYSSILGPEMGGILDRLDSFILPTFIIGLSKKIIK